MTPNAIASTKKPRGTQAFPQMARGSGHHMSLPRQSRKEDEKAGRYKEGD